MTSIGTAWLSHRANFRIQKEKHSEERAERANEFQRVTLLGLQEAIHDSLRLSARAHHEDVMNFRRTGAWARQLLSEEVNEGLRLARRKVAVLNERVSDDSLRADVKSLIDASGRDVLARSEVEADIHQQALWAQVQPLLEKIGRVLRSHY